MPEATTPNLEADLPNPVIDDGSLKQMASKFAELMKPAPAPVAETPKPAEQPKAEIPKQGEAPAAEAKPTEVKPTDAKPEPDNSPARENFRKLEAVAKAEAKRAKELEAKLAELTKNPVEQQFKATLAEKEALAKQVEELTSVVETAKFERSPRFQQWWQEETSKHINAAKRFVPADKQADLEKLLLEPPSTERDAKLSELTDNLPSISKSMVLDSVKGLELAKMKREEALTRGSAEYKKLQEFEQAEQAKQQQLVQQRQAKMAEAALARSRALESFQIKDGDEAHNEQVRMREALVNSYFQGTLEPDEQLLLPVAAADYLHIRQNVLPKLQEENAKLTQLVKQLQASGPSGRDGSAPAKKEISAQPGAEFAAKYRELMGR